MSLNTTWRQVALYHEAVDDLEEQEAIFANFKLNLGSVGDIFIKVHDGRRHMLKDPNNLINFRRAELATGDQPTFYHTKGEGWKRVPRYLWHLGCWNLPDFLQPHYDIRTANDKYKFIQERNLVDLLLANPLTTTGSPLYLKKNGTKFTTKWLRHIYLLSLFQKYLEPYIKDINVVMDIGSGWGIFSHMIKQNYPHTHHILVDLPETNATSYYYLKSEFPNCRVASFREIKRVKTITREFVSNYDFVIVPCFYFEKLEPGLVDLVTNFVSFNEMSPEWLGFYLQSEVFKTSRFFFTVNRVIKEMNRGIKISMLDLPLHKYETIHFDGCPFFNRISYRSKYILGFPYRARKIYNPPLYEFIGKHD